MGLAPSRRSPQQSIADRMTYVGQLAVEVMRKHDERQRLLAIAERSIWKPLAYIGRPMYDQCALRGYSCRGRPEVTPERPLAWSLASRQLLHEGRELGAVHLDGLRKVCLQDGSVFAEPVGTGLPLLLLFAVVGEDFAMRLLWCTRVMQVCTTLMQKSLCSVMVVHHFDAVIVECAAD